MSFTFNPFTGTFDSNDASGDSLQKSYDGNSNILYDGSHPLTVRASGVEFSGSSNALFAADAVGASPFAIPFSSLKPSSGFGLGLPAFASAWSLVGDTAVTFPSATSIEFGAGVNLVTAGVTTASTIQLKQSDVAADEAIYQITSITNGAGTNSVANLGVNYKTFAPANITSTTGTAIATQQVDGFGSANAHFLANIYPVTNSNPATGTSFSTINNGGQIGAGFVAQNSAGTMSQPFYASNLSGATVQNFLLLTNQPGATLNGSMIDLSNYEPTSVQNFISVANELGSVFTVEKTGGVGITIKDTSNTIALDINQNDITNSKDAVRITNTGDGDLLVLTGDGNGNDILGTGSTWRVNSKGFLAGKYMQFVSNDGTNAAVAEFQNGDVTNNPRTVNIFNQGTGDDIGGINWNITKAGDLTIKNASVTQRLLGSSTTATAANDLTLGNANLFLVSGNTAINAITTAGWTAGSKVTLIFSGTPTVNHNTAGGAGTAVIFLSGSAPLTAAANTVLCLEYDGTQWQETSRKVA